MKKTLIYGAATAAVTLSLGMCWNSHSAIETVYGPPPDDPDSPAVTKPEDPEEIDEPIEDVYGPPVIEEQVDLTEYDEDGTPIVPALYGPPPEDSSVPAE